MRPDDPALHTPPSATTSTPNAIPVLRAIPCCVRQAQRPSPAISAHLRAAAVWAALLRPPEPTDDGAEG